MARKRSQSKKILELARVLEETYGNDPVGWIEEFIDFSGLRYHTLTDQQKLICETLIKKKRVAVSAGGGLGKSAVTAMLILWGLACHPHAKIPTTAPTGKQLHDVLWSELRFWLSRCRLEHLFEPRVSKLYIKGFKEWYAVARTVPKDSKDINDTLAGFHAPWMLTAVDEASGVDDAVFTALEGAMTQENSYILLISNPVSTGGYFYDTLVDRDGKGKDYEVLFLSSLESPLVDPDYEKKIATRYGADSAMYRTKVLGMPVEATGWAVVAPQVYDEVVVRNKEVQAGGVVLGVDVAGQGEDSTVICHRRGNSIIDWSEYSTNDTTFLIDEIVRIWQSRYMGEMFCCIVDAVGLGAGVYDGLRRLKLFPVVAFLGGSKADQEMAYENKRSEVYYKLSKAFKDLHFPKEPPERLKKELANILFDPKKERVAIARKEDVRKMLGHSPDYADALAMTFAVDSYAIGFAHNFLKPRVKRAFASLGGLRREERYGRFGRFLQ
ncbi:MAG: hypothetical protein DRO11_03485 [Methanobacteriota archaeon]|nr:MAG: hypothetical protein DRO11_03485 [Euryarchaeota archaeon]